MTSEVETVLVSPEQKFRDAITVMVFMERFYAALINKMRVRWTKEVPTAGVYVTDKIHLVINPDFVNKLTVQEVVELLRHECNHIVYRHIPRAMELGIDQGKLTEDQKDNMTQEELNNRMVRHKIFNLSADTAINHDCPKLINNHGGVDNKKIEEVLFEYSGKEYSIQSRQSMEHYYGYVSQLEEEMTKKANEMSDKIKELMEKGNIDDHSIWDQSTGGSDLIDQVIKSAVGKAAKEARNAGSISSDLDKVIEDLLTSKVNWRKELSKFFTNALKYNKTQTRAKRNRRYGLLFAGKKKKPQLSIALCMDVSGSMSDTQVAQIFTEIDKIHGMGVEIHVIQADTEVKSSELYNPKKPWARLGSGGTAYGPAILYAKNELEVDGIIYAGDFDAFDTPQNPHVNFLWLGVNTTQKAPGNFGRTIYIND